MQKKIETSIQESIFISRDLSWLQFNYRVLDQAKKKSRNIFDRLKFMAIAASNLDEFFMVRVGSLYNYLDYGKKRIDYSGLRETTFKKKLYKEIHEFINQQVTHYENELVPLFKKNNFEIKRHKELSKIHKEKADDYFTKTIYPMLTPMAYDIYHVFPLLMNQILIFAVITKNIGGKKEKKKLSFVQIPQNLPRFFDIEHGENTLFVPIEDIIEAHLSSLFRNVSILSASLFRITRNGDFTLDESEDMDMDFVEEVKRKLKTRRTGRVVRIEMVKDCDPYIANIFRFRWEIDDDNIFEFNEDTLIDFTCLWQIINHPNIKSQLSLTHSTVPSLTLPDLSEDIFEVLKRKDVLLHHPYNSMTPLIQLLEKAAEDPHVLSVKLTIYRLAKESRIISALLHASENGKHVSVLFELKARFDEENNIKEAKRLQQAGCFVIYGLNNLKTHTKLLLIVRKEKEQVTRYVHMSSGNYNENTARLYTDLSLMSSSEIYAHDVSEFFNVITGHSFPSDYKYLTTAPHEMRNTLISLVEQESQNAKKGKPAGIVIKINSLEDKGTIEKLYEASQAGVQIKLIIRGICCLRPGRKGLSENIQVISIVGKFLEHSRIFYFHNNNDPVIYVGSADVMIRSFDRRMESLFRIADPIIKQQIINILTYNLLDNVNAYTMNENSSYSHREIKNQEEPFNMHEKFYNVTMDIVKESSLF